MPGLAGIITREPTADYTVDLGLMLESMRYKPFYVSGSEVFSDLGIYAGWVAHPGSFAARHSFCDVDSDVALVLSGECFEGDHANSPPGKSWIIQNYAKLEECFLENLNGLFSGLLIDKRLKKALLFNDRYGLERIYWHETRDATYFASEAKALLRVLPELREFHQEGVTQFLTFGCTLGQRTLFQGVELLPEASLWSFENGKCQKTKYFSPETWESQAILPAEFFMAEFQERFKRVLPRYFESESRIGISLTAGLDTRMIMACLPKAREKLVCYTFSGEKRDTLDALLAARVAEIAGLEHQVLRIGSDFFSDFASHVDRTVYITDGSLGSLGAHEIYLNNQARALSPVRLTGVFGGEILRGVSMFEPLHLAHRLVNADLAKTVTSCGRRWSNDGEHPVTFVAFREIPELRFASVAASRSQVTFRTPYLDNDIVALAYQAPETVRMSIDCTLSLVKANNPSLSKVPTDMGEMGEANPLAVSLRRIFTKAACKLDYFRSEGLPQGLSRLDPLLTQVSSALGIAGLHKYLPYRIWFQRELAAYVDGILKDAQVRHNSLWNYRFLEHMASDHAAGHKNYVREIDAVLTLDAVERLLFRDLPRAARH
jgi:asparagine synthase (glutamine-hydrolysing)